MPYSFLKCVKEGGKVITTKIGKNKYVHLCKDKNGKWHRGEIKTKKGK